MRKKFLKYLIDPATGEDLGIEIHTEKDDDIIEGSLVSEHNRYPIIRGIPRFAGYKDNTSYTKSFDYQWNKWSKIQFDSQNVGKPMQGHTGKMWERITGITSSELNKDIFVDFGCGPGRFIETIINKNGIAIGIDLSDAVEAAAENFANNPDVLICQADILHSPIRPESVDVVFSIGVLHHTNNAKEGFGKIIEAVKPGGRIAVSVYSCGGYYDNFFVTIYRKIFKALWPIFGPYPPLFYSYTTVYLFRPILRIPIVRTLIRPFLIFFPFINLRDIRWSVLDTFDSVTPSNQYCFTPYQVFQWFKLAGLRGIEPSNWGGSSFMAKK